MRPAVGIIAEYNPFHLGHARQIAALREILGADCAGLGAKAGIAHPARWQAVRERWPEWFSQVPVEIQVEVKIL